MNEFKARAWEVVEHELLEAIEVPAVELVVNLTQPLLVLSAIAFW